MADIHLTNGDDVYVQLAADKDTGNNIWGDDGNDVIKMYGGTAIGGKGNDRFEFIATPGEPWREMGVAYWSSPSGIEVNLAEGWANDGFGGHDTLIGIRRVHGSGNDDKFIGDASDNYFHPNGGHDTLDGGAGYDGIDVREIPPNADGSGTWRPAVLGDLGIVVSPDARTAVITVLHYPRIQYTLSNIEYFNLINDTKTYLLADFITPQSMAEQTIAAGGTARWNAPGALGTGASVSFSFVEAAPISGPGATGFRAFTGAERQAVRDILHDTSLVAGISFAEVAEAPGVAGTMRFGVSQQAATKGVAYAPNTAPGNPTAGDVWMDVESMFNLTPGSEGFAALRHEIGHALGLRHPTNSDPGDAWSQVLRAVDDRSSLSVMSGSTSVDGLFRADWGLLDVAALRYLYGSQALNLGNSVLQVGALDAQAQRTLVDDGGIDTLDASLSPAGVSLDLSPGHSSSVGLSVQGLAGVDNLGLGVGSWIENAVGSAGDDVLLGNALDNRLEGMAGNDWIDGAAGVDTAVFAGARTSYFVSTGFGKVFVAARDLVQGFDTLLQVERLAFADGDINLGTVALGSDLNASIDEDSLAQGALPDPSDLTRAAVSYARLAGPAHGTVSVSAAGSYVYMPQANFNGADSFSYSLSDGLGHSNSYRVYLNVLAVNDAPAGGIALHGSVAPGGTLSATSSMTDAEGLGPLGYQWLADGSAIDGATTSALHLTQADLGKSISVQVSYTDLAGTNESLRSALFLVAADKSIGVQAYGWNTHTLLSGVSINGASQNPSTDASGAASLSGVSDASLPLSASRAVPGGEAASTASAVNVQDAIDILKMVVGLDVNGANKPLSPYQALAADFDANGAVNVSDAIAVLRHVVGLAAPEPAWRFADELDPGMPGKTGLNPGLAPQIEAQLGGTSPVHVGLVGYLAGDVNGSFSAPAAAQDLDLTQPAYFTALIGQHPELSLAQFGIYAP